MQVTLTKMPLSEDPSKRFYVLRVVDTEADKISEIPIFEDTPTSGLTLEKWKHSTRKRDKDKNVIGVYFWVSIMGHELDQWRYYDLDTKTDVTK